MAELLRMPEVAAGMESAVLSTWSIPENTPYAAGDVIAIIETDKAIVDVEADTDGVILTRLVTDGTDVPVGDPIALIGDVGETIDDLDATLAHLGVTTTAAATTAEAQAARQSPLATSPMPSPTPVTGEPHAAGPETLGRIFGSPIARRMARHAGIPLTAITGTGPNGRIIRRDVEAAIASRASAPTAPTPAIAEESEGRAAAPAAPSPAGAATDIPHTRLRRMIAARLTESKQNAPHFYVKGSANVDALLALRTQINDCEELRVSLNDLIIKAVAKAHILVPAINVIWTADAIRCFPTVDISVAVATDTGLVTPVLRSVESMTIAAVASATKDFAARARTGRLQQAELEGGTISVSNLGMLGTEEFTAIINPPQAAILAVGAARPEPVVIDGQLAVATVMHVTLSVDHRPVDGAVAAEWMRTFLNLLEQPAKILA